MFWLCGRMLEILVAMLLHASVSEWIIFWILMFTFLLLLCCALLLFCWNKIVLGKDIAYIIYFDILPEILWLWAIAYSSKGCSHLPRGCSNPKGGLWCISNIGSLCLRRGCSSTQAPAGYATGCESSWCGDEETRIFQKTLACIHKVWW